MKSMKRWILGFIMGVFMGALSFFLVDRVVPETTSKISILKIEPSVVLADINVFRKENGLTPLVEHPTLCSMAKTRLPEVIKNWSHDGFSADRFCKVNCRVGENLSKNFRTEQQIVDNWINSPGHKEVMLMKDIKYGCVASNGQYTVLEVSSTIPY